MKNRLVILAILQTLVYCQAPMPVCSNNSTYNWLYNSAGVSPCTIMTSLFQVCDPSHYFPALPLGSEYGVILGVNSDNACICNSVFYEISSACAYCQGRTWRTWSEYKTNCSTIYVQNFPYRLPGNTRVPSWAYVDVGTFLEFSPPIAQIIDSSGLPDSTALPTSTIQTPGTRTGVPGRTNIPTPTLNFDSSNSDSRVNPGIVAGAVVASIAALGIAIALFYCRRRRMRRRNAQVGLLPSTQVLEKPSAISDFKGSNTPSPNIIAYEDVKDGSTHPLLASSPETPASVQETSTPVVVSPPTTPMSSAGTPAPASLPVMPFNSYGHIPALVVQPTPITTYYTGAPEPH